ncbi:TerC family protein [Furfurilactobacillus siliginis]|uniref:Membrane protein n=1 Tax=Furfurilactobacillus siliginis TaxID=348151 RepID=A0A0R2LBG4_9LACO|nr:TerC family protein [Furfurilactobacillus siliginis]KRN96410.1 integral membrane protein [Furfurilactobacillus siliginis]GEK29527.1 membrane protein [Furfurilactobacillus siliginis]
MLHLLSQLYGPFFDGHNWAAVLTSGNDWLIIGSLVLIECLLSVDNAVVLAAQTTSLTNLREREKSLFYGLWGAYLFRFLIIGIGTYLIDFWIIKVIGAAYLCYLVYRYFHHLVTKRKRHPVDGTAQPVKPRRIAGLSTFWSVVVQIEIMDIVFSIDSVLTSLAISNNPVVVLIGGLIGILCMRGIAEIIMNLMRRIPELETMAYVLIGVIAVKLFLSIPAIDIEIPAPIFGLFVLSAVGVTFVIHFFRRAHHKTTKAN